MRPPPPTINPPSIGESDEAVALQKNHQDQPPGYERASLKLAKKFFKERLPRRVEDETQPTKHRLARIGEMVDEKGQESQLYHPWSNGVADLAEFGVGVSLYFRQLLFFASVLVLCTIIYCVSMAYNRSHINPPLTNLLAQGSVFGALRKDLLITKHGIPDMLVTIVLLLFAFSSKKVELRAREVIDLAQQTPQDYSIVIRNPVPNVTDPDVYEQKFKKFGRVVFITITVDNGPLLKAVLRKRVIEHKLIVLQISVNFALSMSTEGEEGSGPTRLQSKQTTRDLSVVGEAEVEVNIERVESQPILSAPKLAKWKRCLQRFGLFETEQYLTAEHEKVENLITELCHESKVYSPHTVYVTFDTEAAQRACLKECYHHSLMVHKYDISLLRWFGKAAGSTVEIEGHPIKAVEAPEPTSILWENLDQSNKMIVGWFLFSCLVCGGLMALSFFVVNRLTTASKSITVAIFIALVNNSLPLCVTFITWTLEVHRDLGDLQASMMLKLVVVRCVNSAILLYLATTFADTFHEETMDQVMLILLADAVVSPLIRLADPYGIFERVIRARRQITQAEMNVFFQGTTWHLAERYTDLMKTVFVGLFYSAVVPAGIVVTAIAMITNYWTDKYLLFRIWRRPPAYDHTLAAQTRKYVLFTLWVHVNVTRVFYANWPYQPPDMPVEVKADCGPFRCKDPTGAWTPDQKTLAEGYGVFDIVVFVVILVGFFIYYVAWHVQSLFKRTEDDARGETNSALFSEVQGISCYCPVARDASLVDPFLAIDVTELPANALPYLPLNMGGTYNAKELSMSTEERFPDIERERRTELFARLKYYPGADEMLAEQSVDAQFGYNSYHTAFESVGTALGKAHYRSYRSGVMAGSLYNIPTSAPQSGSSADYPLPFGWEQRTTPDGKIYYANHSARCTQWARPQENTLIKPASGGTQQIISTPYVHQAVADLPSGWEARFTPQGRPYYVNHAARTTQWQHPRVALMENGGVTFGGTTTDFTAASAAGPSLRRQPSILRQPSKADIEKILPEGWQIRFTDAGRPYYANHKERKTQWKFPTQ